MYHMVHLSICSLIHQLLDIFDTTCPESLNVILVLNAHCVLETKLHQED